MTKMPRKNLHLPDDVVRLIGDVLHTARFRSETQAVAAMLEGASDRLKDAQGYVYLMRGEKGLKIGTSIQPNVRASNLKSELLYCIHGDRLTELAVHMLWGRYRLSARGEWFSEEEEIVQWFANHELGVSLDDVSDVAKTPTNLALDPDILARIDAWIKQQEFAPTKTQVFETALREFLEKREAASDD